LAARIRMLTSTVLLAFCGLVTGAEWPKVSILTPTCLDRHFMHPTLYTVFSEQTYPGELELIMVDGFCKRSELGTELIESAFMVDIASKDSRVTYSLDASRNAAKIGAKRARMAQLATGDIIAHFDDDDFYAPTYIQTMVQTMQDNGADFVKLNAWSNYGDIRLDGGVMDRQFSHIDYVDSYMKHGYGFTYVFKKAILEDVPYVEMDAREDQTWLSHVQKFDFLLDSGKREKKFKTHLFKAGDDCLVLRVVCNSVHRFAGMPDPKHLARGKYTVLDEEDFLDKCAGDVDSFLEQVDYIQLKREEEALAEFAASQEGAQPQEVSPSEYHGQHEEL